MRTLTHAWMRLRVGTGCCACECAHVPFTSLLPPHQFCPATWGCGCIAAFCCLQVHFSLSHVNPFLVCGRCGGYLINATTLSECLHTCKQSGCWCVAQMERERVCVCVRACVCACVTDRQTDKNTRQKCSQRSSLDQDGLHQGRPHRWKSKSLKSMTTQMTMKSTTAPTMAVTAATAMAAGEAEKEKVKEHKERAAQEVAHQEAQEAAAMTRATVVTAMNPWMSLWIHKPHV